MKNYTGIDNFVNMRITLITNYFTQEIIDIGMAFGQYRQVKVSIVAPYTGFIGPNREAYSHIDSIKQISEMPIIPCHLISPTLPECGFVPEIQSIVANLEADHTFIFGDSIIERQIYHRNVHLIENQSDSIGFRIQWQDKLKPIDKVFGFSSHKDRLLRINKRYNYDMQIYSQQENTQSIPIYSTLKHIPKLVILDECTPFYWDKMGRFVAALSSLDIPIIYNKQDKWLSTQIGEYGESLDDNLSKVESSYKIYQNKFSLEHFAHQIITPLLPL